MKQPDRKQLTCLRRIAAGGSGTLRPCEERTLEELLAAGLIERAPRIWLPVQLIRMQYRLTPRGEHVLHGH